MREDVILVDENDLQIGQMEKLEAHQKGELHRAFSIFIFNNKNELLLQRRAKNKYHSGGLWTNTCCSHPRLGETNLAAANRRLKEEMGMECALNPVFSFLYKASFNDGLTEHELDHVFFGYSEGLPNLNTDEADDYRYVTLAALQKEIDEKPEAFTKWLQICLPKVSDYYNNR
ncbi:isopentenyl-diphosphate Delta-isomerase [Pedobacter endophyticus]|uniref:Isopentenyl-diphosphate delta-isomerase n=1 Tax=Pedobacter endophyticus TaxID=2789740 RepID=A0A7S9L1I5_9SPHI|nr:isopentenyl-diphosphate Delta-isomerase [Pedobacter endophyticus]QPH40787.1 isopentenyl-diphosphate Delta-isomerase [Pedobacter endophyticus]